MTIEEFCEICERRGMVIPEDCLNTQESAAYTFPMFKDLIFVFYDSGKVQQIFNKNWHPEDGCGVATANIQDYPNINEPKEFEKIMDSMVDNYKNILKVSRKQQIGKL